MVMLLPPLLATYTLPLDDTATAAGKLTPAVIAPVYLSVAE
jgi:hypothetical protein